MLKMIDVLEQRLVQNFSDTLSNAADQLDIQVSQALMNVSDLDLHSIISAFFMRHDAAEIAQALDIHADTIEALQAAENLKQDTLIDATAKIVAYGLAVETEALDQVEVPESLQDYPM